jgi:ribosomal protein S18 acetylase RimI-like enzyme
MGHPLPRPRIRVRDMTVDDVPKVFHLGEKIYNVSKRPFLYRTWDPYEVAQLFASETDLSLVADFDGELAGFCLATTIEKPSKPWRYGYLIWLGVSPPMQSSKVGSKLVTELLRRMKAKKVRFMLVDTEETNTKAIGFFERMGFEIRHRQVWMWKNLGETKPSYRTLIESISRLHIREQEKT